MLSLDFSEIVSDDRHWKVYKSHNLGFLRKILIMPKLRELDLFLGSKSTPELSSKFVL